MSLEPTKIEIKKEDYITTGAGAIAGGAGAYGIINGRIKNFAKKTVNALNSAPSECDTFVRKNENIISKASVSGKGFFGKLNKAIRGLNPEESSFAGEIKERTKTVLDSYNAKATAKLGEDATAESVKALKDKFISKDIATSVKNAFKFENAIKIAGAVVAGAILINVAKEAIQKINSNRIIKKTEKELQKEEELKAKESEEKVNDKVQPQDMNEEELPEETLKDESVENTDDALKESSEDVSDKE